MERFEDPGAWQKTRLVVVRAHELTTCPCFRRDFDLTRQIRGAAVSILSNIAEGFEGGRTGDFHQVLSIAKSSCAELRSHLYVALDIGYLECERWREIMDQAEEVGRIVGGLRVAVGR